MSTLSNLGAVGATIGAVKRSGPVVVATLLLLLYAPAVHSAGPMRPFQLGLWSGGAYTNDQTGTFSHCGASVGYHSGILMLVTINRSFGWALGFYSPEWNLVPKTQIPVELHFDDGPTFNAVATVLLPKLAQITMPDNSRLINTFRFALQMSATAQGQSFLFNLTATSKLMVQLADCVRTSLALETGRSPGMPAGAAGLHPQPAMPNHTQETILEETQLATNFLLAAQLPKAHLLGRNEIPVQLASYGAVWKADDAIGAVKIYLPQAGLIGLDLASQIIAGDAQSCRGKFASARYSELIDNDVVFRAVTSCSDSEHETEAQYFIAPRSGGGFVGFSVLAATASERQSVSSDQKVDVFKKAALIAVAKH